jgi:hypothetical protein
VSDVFGSVTVHGGDVARNATVELHNVSGDHITQTVVDDSGSYRFHLAPGKWRLKAYDPHGHRGSAEVELGTEDKRVDLDLDEPEGGH